MSYPSPHLYRRTALAQGREPATVDRALAVEQRTRSHRARPIFTLAHLAQLTGATWHYLRRVVTREIDPYVAISRPKRDGTTRPIASPEPVLMDVQRWLLANVVCALEVDDHSYAYQSGRSIIDCAQTHVGSRWLVKLDIHDFFGSVSERRVYGLFNGLGYPRLLALELARICTHAPDRTENARYDVHYRKAAPYEVAVEGALPQGAPTSGMLANAGMLQVDKELAALASDQGLQYTRYSDDLTFSTAGAFSRQKASTTVARARAILKRHGFALHRKKTRVVPPGARHIVLGLVLDHDRVLLRKEYKRRIELHVWGVSQRGLSAHANCRKFNSVLSFINHIDGHLAFAASVEPVFAERMSKSWEAALRKHGYPTTLGDVGLG